MSDEINPPEVVTALLSGHCLLDVRSPGEFCHMEAPGFLNLPLLTNEERRDVGICYRHQGQEAAIALGEQLVSGAVRSARIEAWVTASRTQRVSAVMCARGGLRSQIAQRWIREAGVSLPRVSGGYKQLRQYLLSSIDSIADRLVPLIVCGSTGVGKTLVLNAPELAPHAIDLERAAEHCGSGFGDLFGAQPSQATFENRIALELCRLDRRGSGICLLEDESRAIGSVRIPPALFSRIGSGKRVVIRAPIEERIALIRLQYVEAQVSGRDSLNVDGSLERYLFNSLRKIERRLGGARAAQYHAMMTEALRRQREDGDPRGHDVWIRALLETYYDPMYERALQAVRNLICFEGTAEEVRSYLANYLKSPDIC